MSDPSEAYDSVADTFRREIAKAAFRMLRVTTYRELSPALQIEAVLVGGLTGVLAVAFAHVAGPADRDMIMQFLSNALPTAREAAEATTLKTAEGEPQMSNVGRK